MKTSVFLGISKDKKIDCAVLAGSISEAKVILNGLDVIKLTGKSEVFICNRDCFLLKGGKKIVLTGNTEQPKGFRPFPSPIVSVLNGVIEFLSPIYDADGSKCYDSNGNKSFWIRFDNKKGNPSNWFIC